MDFTAPKKSHYIYFFGRTPHFISEKQNTRTYHLQHWKTVSVALVLSLRVGIKHTKKWCNNFCNALAVKCTLYLARPHS